jgi:structure-specific recognition protein 1
MKIVSKGGAQLFAGIERAELDNLSDYFQSRKIKVSRIQEEMAKVPLADSEDDEDVEDDSRQHKPNVFCDNHNHLEQQPPEYGLR